MLKISGSLGLCGAHRTGKTTLAQAIASRLEIAFASTTTSQVFADLGLDPAAPMDFTTRLFVQHHTLDAAVKIWQGAIAPFISDRTPIDMIAYTLGDIQGKTEVNERSLQQLHQYIDRCFAVTNQYFPNLAIIQPGIPLVYAAGKAALNDAYIEHINVLVIGLCADPRLNAKIFCNSRKAIALDLRIANILQEFADL